MLNIITNLFKRKEENGLYQQVKFYDRENDNTLGGILMPNGNILCGCCGGIIEADEIGDTDDKDYAILDTYKYWVNLTDSIVS